VSRAVRSLFQIGDVACKLAHFVLYVTVYVTVYTLVALNNASGYRANGITDYGYG